MEGKTPDKQWKRINHVATSLHETKSLYLPGNTVLGLSRSVADFGEAFTLPRKLLEDLARRGRRVASLGDRAIEYLQFRLNVMRTRVAQDDYAWPSAEDLGIKIADLDDRIKDLDRKAAKEEEASREKIGDEKLKLETGAKWKREEAAELRAERGRAVEAQKVADNVAGVDDAAGGEQMRVISEEIEPGLEAPSGVAGQEVIAAAPPITQRMEQGKSQPPTSEPPDTPPTAPAA